MTHGLALHVHHDTLLGWCYNLEERLEYIERYKPEHERPLRKRLLQIIPDDRIPGKDSVEWQAYDQAGQAYGQAWQAYDQARQAYDQAWQAYDQAGQAYDQAWQVYDQARQVYDQAWQVYGQAYGQEIAKLHAELCPNCPWDGKTIFPEEK